MRVEGVGLRVKNEGGGCRFKGASLRVQLSGCRFEVAGCWRLASDL